MGYRKWLPLLLLLLPGLSLAGTGLFDARMEVDSESSAERDEATRDGLETILTRLTGRENPGDDEALAEVLDQANRYVQQYGYDAGDDDGLLLRVRYDGRALQRELVEQEIPLWPREQRPRTLAWVVVDQGGSRRILGGDESPDLQDALRDAGARTGLPLLFPLMDLEDQQAIRASEIWGGFREPVESASERYDADAVLVGRVSQRGQGWRGRWVLYWEGESHSWTMDDDSAPGVLDVGLEIGMTRLAEYYAVIPEDGEVGRLTVRVRDIGGLDSYGRVERYLRDLSGVEAVDAVRMGGGAVDFRLTFQGLPERALQRMRSGSLLAEQELDEGDGPDADEDGSRPDYIFRLNGS
ncbi:DUF2066 domain-containing protein [Aquisalimonas asiatica]|uniref:DUF2066 domain-containing protein n=1 Tax=Aquisalimonas asiatica TaxID=406100 RepID=A0A1H8RLB5_9GAMM|nr:DUF2066 domain-containing protein [Aquisalimonas asiatica]SEO67349.1 hypothetical protein SAMN04488052_102110 [Aquisalimonas asiatica]